MAGFLSMADRHAVAMERLAEMSGKLVERAYERAMRNGESEEQDRALLLFDRLARGFRLTIALEAKMDRDRRRDAAGISWETAPQSAAPRLPSPVVGPRPARPAREADHEADAGLEPTDLPGLVQDLRATVTGHAAILDPDGTHAQALDRWTGDWSDEAEAPPTRVTPTRRSGRPSGKHELLAGSSSAPHPPRRASG